MGLESNTNPVYMNDHVQAVLVSRPEAWAVNPKFMLFFETGYGKAVYHCNDAVS